MKAALITTVLSLIVIFNTPKVCSQPDENYILKTSSNQIKLVSYNAENLFDTEHDIENNKDKNDWAYLPTNYPGKAAACKALKSSRRRSECRNISWTKAKLAEKIRRIARTIKAQGSMPDLLGVVEIENDKVAAMLSKALGYGDNFIITKSQDRRGIDVALFYKTEKLKLIDHHEIKVDPKKLFATRNILAANFTIRGANQQKVLGVYVNHWPSQFSPAFARGFTAKLLRKNIQKQTTRFGKNDYHVVAMGDFNSIAYDYPHPIQHIMTNPVMKDHMRDVQVLVKSLPFKKRNPLQEKMPQGTYFYAPNMSWNRLDRFLISQNLNDDSGIDVVLSSFRIVAPSFLTKTLIAGNKLKSKHHHGSKFTGVPKRFNFIPPRSNPNEIGYSDHFAIAMIIRY